MTYGNYESLIVERHERDAREPRVHGRCRYGAAAPNGAHV